MFDMRLFGRTDVLDQLGHLAIELTTYGVEGAVENRLVTLGFVIAYG